MSMRRLGVAAIPHSILQALGREGRLLALDRDPQAIEAGRRRFADEVRLTLVHASFADLGALVHYTLTIVARRGVLFDLGVSSPQLDDPRRGFSFRADGPVDMRMDPTRGEPVFGMARSGGRRRDTPGDRHLRRGALRARAWHRRSSRRVASSALARTAELAALVAGAVRDSQPGKHPATRTFQALRMFTNDELGQLERGLTGALRCAQRPAGARR
mgnify:CR=1 FL=1